MYNEGTKATGGFIVQWFPKTKLGKVNLALLAVLIGLIGCFFVLLNNNQTGQNLAGAVQKISDEPAKKKKQDANKVVVTSEKSPFKEISYTTEQSSSDKYTLMYPTTGIPDVDKAIQKKIYNKRDKYIKSDAKKLVLSIKSTTSGKKITFIVKQKELQQNQSVVTSAQTFTYDRGTKKLRTIQDVIKTDTRLNRLSKEARTKLQQKNTALNISAKKIEQLTAPTWKNFETFALDGTNLKVYYQPHTFADKLTAVTIPLSNLDKKYDVPVFSLNTHGKKYVALTFDDGPHKTVTPRILKTLKKHNAKATFYMLGNSANAAPAIAKSVVQQGHEIGNHSYGHENLSKMTATQALSNIERSNALIKKATGVEPLTIRPPYGARNHGLEQQLSQPTVLWSVDTLDWKTRNAAATLQVVKQKLHPGAIILMHDIHSTTADALDSILTYLDNKGYTCVTISQLEGKAQP